MSVLLDTNVVSELIRPSPNLAVGDWAAARILEDLFFSAVGEAELRYGAAILAAGRRREMLIADIERFLREAFDDRILPFDSAAARAYADIAATRRFAGRPTQPADCQIAAIARSPQHDRGDSQRPGFRGHGHRCRRPLDLQMNRTGEAIAFSLEVNGETVETVKGKYGGEVKVPDANNLDQIIQERGFDVLTV